MSTALAGGRRAAGRIVMRVQSSVQNGVRADRMEISYAGMFGILPCGKELAESDEGRALGKTEAAPGGVAGL